MSAHAMDGFSRERRRLSRFGRVYPKWSWAARAASLPGALAALELGYRMFLPVRPFISRVFGQVLKLQSVFDGAKPR